jgi:trehalose/maltose hydrolase-like predicted phosphorylase
VLDMRRGVLTRHLRWVTPAGKDALMIVCPTSANPYACSA